VFVLVSPTTYQLDLKAIEGEIPTRNFVIKPQSVVQVKEGDNLVVATQPITQVVESVKIQDQRGVIKELESLGNNVYSLAGIPVGNYILDVVADVGSAKKGTYETILVILAQGQQPVQPAQIINKFFFDNGGNNTNGNKTKPPPECEPGFELVGDNCLPIPCPAGSELVGTICEPLPDPICDPSSPECAPTQCPDGRTMPPGVPCPEDALPCDHPNAPEGCSVPTECPDGRIIPPGQQCPEDSLEQGEQGEQGGQGGQGGQGEQGGDEDNDNGSDNTDEGGNDETEEGQGQDQGSSDGTSDDSMFG
jgi:hypothetical protein